MTIHPRTLLPAMLRYRETSPSRALFELAITATALVTLWVLMWLSLDVSYWLTLLLAIPAAGFMVRLFLIQHDCGHGAFFRSRVLNDGLGRVLGVFTLTPYDYWKGNHSIHHATCSNLDQRGIGDVDTLTVAEYRALPLHRRIGYRIYRNGFFIFGFGAVYLFFIQHRLPFFQMRNGWRPWVSTMATNAALALAVTGMIWLVGTRPFLMVHLPIMLLAASMGVWLFYVQHQFEDVQWSHDGTWAPQDAALSGSSYYDLPPVLRWLTANIGIHHVHHLNSRIPFYRLPQVLKDHPELQSVGRLTFRESLRCVNLSLWCETRKKLVSFADLTPPQMVTNEQG